MLYKICNHLVDTDFTSQLTLRQSSTRGHASRFLQPQRSCAAYSSSFLPRTVRDWNALALDPLLFRLRMPSRTTSSLIRHLITSVFNLLFYPPAVASIPPKELGAIPPKTEVWGRKSPSRVQGYSAGETVEICNSIV